ncbi:MAG TPA: hypothetical protein PLB99_11730 [Thermotogota bacterium]|mgnify:FL=1|nr:hypothetical protein [Thermotogota bacterium]
MKKRFNNTMMILYLTGMSLFLISSLFRENLSDFLCGFLEGLSFTLIVGTFIYMCWCFAHKKNPFLILIKGEEDER